MTKLTMVYPSLTKELHTSVLLYSPLAIPYLGRHTPDHYTITACESTSATTWIPPRWMPILWRFRP